jgi:hypothetical protein
MSRNIDTTSAVYLAGSGGNVLYTILIDITFSNETLYLHIGGGTISANGNYYSGVGSFGSLSPISETLDLQAQGIQMSLTGIPTQLLTDATQYCTGLGACNAYLAMVTPGGSLVSHTTPIKLWGGLVDAPSIDIGGETFTITLSSENRMANLNRARNSRYTAADQKSKYPNDDGLNFVQFLANMVIILKNKS